jgi:hypothetical protein
VVDCVAILSGSTQVAESDLRNRHCNKNQKWIPRDKIFKITDTVQYNCTVKVCVCQKTAHTICTPSCTIFVRSASSLYLGSNFSDRTVEEQWRRNDGCKVTKSRLKTGHTFEFQTMELTQHPCIGVKEYLTRLRFFILSDSQSKAQSYYPSNMTRFGLIIWNFLFSWFIPRDLWTCMVLVDKKSRPNALVEEYPSLRGIDKVLSPQDGNLQAILTLRLVPIVRPFRWNSTT